MEFFNTLAKVIPSAAGEPYVLAAMIVVVVGWLIFFNRKNRSKDFIFAGESLKPEDRPDFYKSAGYSYDELATLPENHRLSVITKKYRFFAYLATLFFLSICLFAVLNSLSENTPIKVEHKISEAISHYKKGRFGEAYVAYKEAYALSHEKNHEAKYGAAKSLIRKGEYDQALPLINSGIADTGNENLLLKSKFLSLYALYLKNGERREDALVALDEAKSVIDGCTSKECIEHLAAVYGNIGNTYGFMGDYDESEKYLKKAIEQDNLAGDKRGYLVDRGNLASLYQRIGKNKLATEILSENFQEWMSLEEHYEVAYTRYKLARSIEKSDLDAASVHYSEALRYINEHKVDDKRLKARIIGDHAKLFVKNEKNLNHALLKTVKSLSDNVSGDDKSGIAVQLSSLFYLYEKSKNIECAVVTGSSSLSLLKNINAEYFDDLNSDYEALFQYQSVGEKDYRAFIDHLAVCTDIASEIWFGIFTTLPTQRFGG